MVWRWTIIEAIILEGHSSRWCNRYVRLRDGRLSTHADRTRGLWARLCRPRYCSVLGVGEKIYICIYRLADSSHFFLGSKVPQIPCSGRRWTTMQNLTPLASSSPEKSMTVQTHTNRQTVTDISTLCLSACVDNKTLKQAWDWTYSKGHGLLTKPVNYKACIQTTLTTVTVQ